MKSLKELFRIGTGPSSSHTMGPRKAAETFRDTHPDAASYEVTLYGSLAATGKGHMTDVAIIDELSKTEKKVEIIWKPDIFLDFHPNGMTFKSIDNNGKSTDEWTVFSVGGGALEEPGKPHTESGETRWSWSSTACRPLPSRPARCNPRCRPHPRPAHCRT